LFILSSPFLFVFGDVTREQMMLQVMLVMHGDGERASLEALELGIFMMFFHYVRF